MNYGRNNHAKFLIVYHLIFVVKYRKPSLLEYGQISSSTLRDPEILESERWK